MLHVMNRKYFFDVHHDFIASKWRWSHWRGCDVFLSCWRFIRDRLNFVFYFWGQLATLENFEAVSSRVPSSLPYLPLISNFFVYVFDSSVNFALNSPNPQRKASFMNSALIYPKYTSILIFTCKRRHPVNPPSTLWHSVFGAKRRASFHVLRAARGDFDGIISCNPADLFMNHS